METITKESIKSGKRLSRFALRIRRSSVYFSIIFIILSFLLLFIRLRNFYKSFEYSVLILFEVLIGTFIAYLASRRVTIRPSVVFTGLISLYFLSYFLTCLYTLYILRLNILDIMLSVWIAYTILMTPLILYYTSFSIPSTLLSSCLYALILIGLNWDKLILNIFLVSIFVLSIPEVLIVLTLETRGSPIKMSDVAHAYFKTFSKSHEYLEYLQNTIGEKETLFSDIIMFRNSNQIFWIVNNMFHYGPYYAIGSSNVPGMIINSLKNVIVFKGPSTHRENISMNKIARSIVKKITNTALHLKLKPIKARYEIIENNLFKAYLIDLSGKILCFVDIKKRGYDDIPWDVFKRLYFIEEISIVDLHTSKGLNDPFKDFKVSDIEALIDLINRGITKLKSKEYSENVWISYAHKIVSESDICSGGIHALEIQIGNKKFLIISFDGNNMEKTLKDAILSHFSRAGYVTIIATTDSHEKTSPLGDYYPVGSITSPQKIINILDDILKDLERNLSEGLVGHRRLRYTVKIVGDNWIYLLRNALKTSKRTIFLVASQVVVIMLLILVFSIL